MSINIVQALILGIFASLSSMPGMGSSSIGNYTLGRPLVGGLVCGLVLGDLRTGILVGVAMQVVYIALVTPGGTVSADVRAVSYIGIPLAMLALNLFYGTATLNLVWQHMGWRAVEKRNYKMIAVTDRYLPWISHVAFSLVPTVIMLMLGQTVVDAIKTYLPMDGLAMKSLFTVGALLPCVGIAILLKQIVRNVTDFIPYLTGFVFAKSIGINLVSATVVAGMFAIIVYKLKMLELAKPAAAAGGFDDDEEEDI